MRIINHLNLFISTSPGSANWQQTLNTHFHPTHVSVFSWIVIPHLTPKFLNLNPTIALWHLLSCSNGRTVVQTARLAGLYCPAMQLLLGICVCRWVNWLNLCCIMYLCILIYLQILHIHQYTDNITRPRLISDRLHCLMSKSEVRLLHKENWKFVQFHVWRRLVDWLEI